MRVLVTGGAGYIGSVLCERLLESGHSVTVLDNLMHGQAGLFHLAHHPKFEFIREDVKEVSTLLDVVDAVEASDVIIPLAALVGAPLCENLPNLAEYTNYRHILGISQLAAGKLIIYPNTNSGYGAHGGMCTEETQPQPISIYGRTKQQAENYLRTAHPNSICLRLATVFGCSPRMRLDLLVNDFTYRAYKDGYLCLYQPHFKRNYVHIRDVADCFLYCIEHADSMVGQVYNLGNDEANCTKLELAERIKQHLPKTEIYVSKHGEDPDKRDYLVSNEKLRQAGFEAKRSLDDGIEELIKGFKMMGRQAYSNV